MSNIDSQLRELLEQAAGDPPRHIAVPAVRRRVIRRRRVRETAAAAIAVLAVTIGATAAVVTQSAQPRPAGLSWRLVSDISQAWHVSLPAGLGNAVSLSCPTASTCYTWTDLAFNGTQVQKIAIEVTHDGGASWQRAYLPADVSLVGDQVGSFDCLSADTCMLLVLSTSGHYEIAETTVGGRTWTTLPGPAQLETDFLVAGGISCTSATSCVLVGNSGFRSVVGQWDAEVTTDGGQTWTQSPVPARPGFPARTDAGMQCFASGNCVIPGDYSTDGGRTWSEGSLPSGIMNASYMSCSDSSHCAAMTGIEHSFTQVVIMTTDGGRTWTQVPGAGFPGNAELTSMTCPTASTCLAAGTIPPVQRQFRPFKLGGQPVLVSTNDQGQTWQAAQLPARYGITWVSSVSCPAATSCFAIGQTTKGLVFLSYGS
jgi:photosystem II stability/assembly factor-like uncharacterized protein